MVKKTLTLDTRNASREDTCYPLQECLLVLIVEPLYVDLERSMAKCMFIMIVRNISHLTERCSSHAVREDKVEELVLKAIQCQIDVLLVMDEALSS